MKSSVVRSSNSIRALSVLDPEQRRALLKVADKKLVEAIVELFNMFQQKLKESNKPVQIEIKEEEPASMDNEKPGKDKIIEEIPLATPDKIRRLLKHLEKQTFLGTMWERYLQGEQITGSFYTQELQKTSLDKSNLYKIEEVLDYRGRGNQREALVKWLNYPNKFNSWVKVSEIKKQT
ncbi:hypothetical protein B566_EDAN017666 [Ephemera danica]|nr:hypothetical protein B566_EDAN017666 [Ephemera danica]